MYMYGTIALCKCWTLDSQHDARQLTDISCPASSICTAFLSYLSKQYR
jgi:hypothetical protein